MTVRVAIADDHPVVLAGLVSFLDQQPGLEVVHENSDVRCAKSLLAATPQVAVLDVRMPGTTPALVGELVAAEVRVVLFTRAPKVARVDALLAAGASGVVSKDADLAELVAAVREVAAGGAYLSEDTGAAPHHALSGRERAVFDALIHSKRPKEIAYDLGLSLSTVYTYAERVRKKLGVEDVRDVVTYAHREGLLETE